MQKIVITGGKGFLGSRFEKMWEGKYEIKALGSRDLDVADKEAVKSYMEREAPDYVFHAAAIPNQQFCMEHPERARAVNVEGALRMAEACRNCGAKLIFPSTEQLFNGNIERGPYSENDTPAPDTVYGQNKLEVEKKLPDILEEYWVIRLTWLFGLPERNCVPGANILWDTIWAAMHRKQIKASKYEFRGMSDVNAVCRNLEKLFTLPYGIYHFGSNNDAGRYDIVKHILEKIGLNEQQIAEILVEDRSKYTEDHVRDLRLDTKKAAEGGIHFMPTKEAIDHCLEEFGIA